MSVNSQFGLSLETFQETWPREALSRLVNSKDKGVSVYARIRTRFALNETVPKAGELKRLTIVKKKANIARMSSP